MRAPGHLLVAVVLAGCQSALPEAPLRRELAPPPRATEFLVKETTLLDGAVSIQLNIPLTPSGPKPTVIALIGDPHQFLGAGFVAVTYSINREVLKGPPPTPLPSGQTVGQWVLASPSAAVLGEHYLRGIAANATQVVPAIIDWLQTLPDVDANRIGMTGASTNGFVTLQAVAADRRIRAATVVAACGDYGDFLRHSSMGLGGAPLALEPSYERWLHSQEVIAHPRQVVHAAVLMVNRSGDTLIPTSCAEATARVLAKAYARAGVADRFRFVRLEESGHGFGPDEEREMFIWMQTWLTGP